jgi:hypothetical protein
MKGILDAVQGAFHFGPEGGAVAANDALVAATPQPLDAAAGAIFVRTDGLAAYGKTTPFLFRADDATPPKA